MPAPLPRDWCSSRMLLQDKMHPCGFKICWRHLSSVHCSFPVMLRVLWEMIDVTEMVDYFRCIQLFSVPTSLYNIAHTCVYQQHVKDYPRAILPILSLSLNAWMASPHKENCHISASCDMRSHGAWTQLPQGWYKKGLYCCHNNSDDSIHWVSPRLPTALLWNVSLLTSDSGTFLPLHQQKMSIFIRTTLLHPSGIKLCCTSSITAVSRLQ